jgi:hypothetical protein
MYQAPIVTAMRTLPRLVTAAGVAAALALAACGGDNAADNAADDASVDAAAGGTDWADSPWTFTDDNDVTHTLDAPPEVVVAQSTIAGGLWEYGVNVAGVFGPLTYADGGPHPSIGLADPDDFASLGEIDGEINIEALAALDPDIIVARPGAPHPPTTGASAPTTSTSSSRSRPSSPSGSRTARWRHRSPGWASSPPPSARPTPTPSTRPAPRSRPRPGGCPTPPTPSRT